MWLGMVISRNPPKMMNPIPIPFCSMSENITTLVIPMSLSLKSMGILAFPICNGNILSNLISSRLVEGGGVKGYVV
jgi:hypothetical protein